MKRCCRTCVFCDVEKRECDEGGYTEIGDLDRELTGEDCNAWEARREEDEEEGVFQTQIRRRFEF